MIPPLLHLLSACVLSQCTLAETIILDMVRYIRGNGATSQASRQRRSSITDVCFQAGRPTRQAAEISLLQSEWAHKYQLMDTCSLSDGSSFPKLSPSLNVPSLGFMPCI